MNIEDRSRDSFGRFAKENVQPPQPVAANKPQPPHPKNANHAARPKTLADVTLPENTPSPRTGKIIATVLTEYLDSRPPHLPGTRPSEQNYSISERLTQARHPHQSTALLSFLSQDANSDVRTSVAENPGTDETILDFLAQNDRDTYVLSAVARNSRTTAETLTRLSERLSAPDRWVEKTALIENPNTPHKVIVKLSHDEDSLVRGQAKERLSRKKFATQ